MVSQSVASTRSPRVASAAVEASEPDAAPRPRTARLASFARARATGAFVFAACLAFALVGCGAAKTPRADDNAVSIASADTRLRGAWRLASFAPTTPLEPMLKAMLEYQYTTMAIRFDGKRVTADSPGVHVNRGYQIAEAYGDHFKLVSYDEQGIPYESWCDFIGDAAIELHSETDPWRGVATLRKVGP
jgi:hypothetical protein